MNGVYAARVISGMQYNEAIDPRYLQVSACAKHFDGA